MPRGTTGDDAPVFDYNVGDIGPGGSPVVAVIARNRSAQQAAVEEAQQRTNLAAREQALRESHTGFEEQQALQSGARQDAAQQFQQSHANAQLQLQKTDAALKQATDYYNVASDMAKKNIETRQRLDAADFMTNFQSVNHDDPHYEQKVAGLFSKYPLAGHDQSVQDVLNVSHAARDQYVRGLQSGQIPGDAHTLDLMEKGVINGNDFVWPAGAPRPATLTENGEINHNAVAQIGALRLGAAAGAPQKAENPQITHARQIVAAFGHKDPEDRTEAENSLYNMALNRLLTYEQGQTGEGSSALRPAVSHGATAPTPASAPAPAATPSQTPVAPEKQAQGGYLIGRKYAGKTYLGGNPQDPNSWQ